MPEELRQNYHRQLREVEDLLLESALRVVELMPRVGRALTSGDTSIDATASGLRQDVAATCTRVEDEAFRLMALQTPVASELRTIVTVLRLVTHVDRSSALLAHVAASTGHLAAPGLPEELRVLINDLATRSAEVFRAGLDAWRGRDAAALQSVVDLDEDVDTLQVELLQRAREMELGNDELVGLGLLARYYERIADHGVAFARDVVFVVTGQRALEEAR